MKEYRIDAFGVNHKKHFFETESQAMEYGKNEVKNGKIVFLLRHIGNGKYDIVSEIK